MQNDTVYNTELDEAIISEEIPENEDTADEEVTSPENEPTETPPDEQAPDTSMEDELKSLREQVKELSALLAKKQEEGRKILKIIEFPVPIWLEMDLKEIG